MVKRDSGDTLVVTSEANTLVESDLGTMIINDSDTEEEQTDGSTPSENYHVFRPNLGRYDRGRSHYVSWWSVGEPMDTL